MSRYIAISGTIGAGKTELAKIYAEKRNSRLILEEFAHNSFLEKFYKNPDRYAFPLEISFLFERFQQQKVELAQGGLFENGFVSDYIFDKSLLFARNNLENDQYKVFYNLYTAFEEQLPKPDLTVYLHRPVEVLLKNIAKRGRSFEKEISFTYLNNLQELYLQYFKNVNDRAVVIVEMKDINFIGNDNLIDKLIEICQRSYNFGTHIIRFEDE